VRMRGGNSSESCQFETLEDWDNFINDLTADNTCNSDGESKISKQKIGYEIHGRPIRRWEHNIKIYFKHVSVVCW